MKRGSRIVVATALLAIVVAGVAWRTLRRDWSLTDATAVLARAQVIGDSDVSAIRRAAWSASARAAPPGPTNEAWNFDQMLLARLRDAGRPWHWSLADLFETRVRFGLVTDEHLASYARVVCPRPSVASVFDPVPFTMGSVATVALEAQVPTARSAPVSGLVQRLTLTDQRVGEQRVDDVVILVTPACDEWGQNPFVQQAGVMNVPAVAGSGTLAWQYMLSREVFWDPDCVLSAEAAEANRSSVSSQIAGPQTQRTPRKPTLIFSDSWPVASSIRFQAP